MGDRPDGQPEDLALVVPILDRSEAGLRAVILLFGPRVKGYLRKHYRDVLDGDELQEAFCRTFEKVWRYAARFDDRKGTLAAWILRIARNCARTILTRERKHNEKALEYDPQYDPADDRSVVEVSDESSGAEQRQRMKDLDAIIDALPNLQRAIVRADLAAGGTADSQRLADLHGSTKNSIEASRSKARSKIRDEMLKRGHFQDKQRATR